MNEKVVTKFAQWRPSARKIWLNVHLWLGLIAGFVLSLIGLSGAFLVVFSPVLEMELGNHLFKVAAPLLSMLRLTIGSRARSAPTATSVPSTLSWARVMASALAMPQTSA